MFLDKYIDSDYLNLLYDNYDNDYINKLDESNFKNVYTILLDNNLSFINDIVLNYLEIFEIDYNYISLALIDLKNILGSNYVNIISNNMSVLDKLIEIALTYEQKDY